MNEPDVSEDSRIYIFGFLIFKNENITTNKDI